MSHTLLIVHPDPAARALITSMLQTLGYRIDEVANDRLAVKRLEREPADMVLADADAADADIPEFLAYIRRKQPGTGVVLLSSNPQPDRARDAMQRGAASMLRFPMPAVQLRAAVAQVLGPAAPPAAAPRPAAAPAAVEAAPSHLSIAKIGSNGNGNGYGHSHHPAGHGPRPAAPPAAPADATALVGDDSTLRQAIELAGTIAPTRAPVLIVGEQGTGKTLLARALHARSPRRDAPFVELSCAALKEAALEAELFGRRGPEGERTGKLAQANGGTLVLDEVSALSSALQYKLLRVLQDGEYEPVGSSQTMRVDVRLVLTTREDLTPLVEEGSFRQDLHYRISVVTLKLPPLRHRGNDIERLADHFRGRFAREIGREVVGFTPDALERLRAHDWPGNVSELANAVERSVVLCRGSRIESAHLSLSTRPAVVLSSARHAAPPPRPHLPASIMPLKEALEGPEKQLILQALEALNWNRQETARVLDINRTTLYKKMKKYGLLFDEPIWAN
jgi:two-component system response regulator HydG